MKIINITNIILKYTLIYRYVFLKNEISKLLLDPSIVLQLISIFSKFNNKY